jgi:PAS domain S-box-containing protein
VASSNGEIVEANPSLAEILGYQSPEEVTRRSISQLLVNRDAAERWWGGLDSRQTLEHIETEMLRADGSSVRVRLNARWVEGEMAGTRQLLGIVDEIQSSEISGADAGRVPVQRERVDDELNQMVYVVSHDLQQPLNVVSRFLDLLAERDGERLTSTGREYLEHARNASGNLQRMVDAVLRYSRIDTSDDQLKPVDLNRVRDKVVKMLSQEVAASAAEITSDELPAVMADEPQMEQLLQNLLSNALKFRSDDHVRIHLSAEERPSEWWISIRDNGIGIDPQEAERIFMMFQRLHTQQEYPGTGIGLAICKRIAMRHGGRIWVESGSGEGSSFFVAIPKRTEPPERAQP